MTVGRNGLEAVQLIERLDEQNLAMFDIVLMDCNMPVMDVYATY